MFEDAAPRHYRLSLSDGLDRVDSVRLGVGRAARRIAAVVWTGHRHAATEPVPSPGIGRHPIDRDMWTSTLRAGNGAARRLTRTNGRRCSRPRWRDSRRPSGAARLRRSLQPLGDGEGDCPRHESRDDEEGRSAAAALLGVHCHKRRAVPAVWQNHTCSDRARRPGSARPGRRLVPADGVEQAAVA
jgi:hypothetical protein